MRFITAPRLSASLFNTRRTSYENVASHQPSQRLHSMHSAMRPTNPSRMPSIRRGGLIAVIRAGARLRAKSIAPAELTEAITRVHVGERCD